MLYRLRNTRSKEVDNNSSVRSNFVSDSVNSTYTSNPTNGFDFSDFSSFDTNYDTNFTVNISHHGLDKMENNDRTLKELATSDVMYQPWCIQYSQLEQAQYELKSGLIHLLPKFHGLTINKKSKLIWQVEFGVPSHPSRDQRCPGQMKSSRPTEVVPAKRVPLLVHLLANSVFACQLRLHVPTTTSRLCLHVPILSLCAKFTLSIRIRPGSKTDSSPTIPTHFHLGNTCSRIAPPFMFSGLLRLTLHLCHDDCRGRLSSPFHVSILHFMYHSKGKTQQCDFRGSTAFRVRNLATVTSNQRSENNIDELTSFVRQQAAGQHHNRPLVQECCMCGSVGNLTNACLVLQEIELQRYQAPPFRQQ
ncbi:hypothetical protein CR513_49403, partial [Mucuna pruriens]